MDPLTLLLWGLAIVVGIWAFTLVLYLVVVIILLIAVGGDETTRIIKRSKRR